MAEGPQVRRIMASDGAVLRALRLRSLSDAPDAFGQRLDEAEAMPESEWRHAALAASEGDRRAWFLAFESDLPVGLVLGRRRRPGTLLLFSMWVAPEARRRGLGGRLIATLEAWAGGWQARETLLWVLRDNAPALAFYERLGFTRVLDGPDAESGAQHGALAMRRAIPAAAG